MSLILVPADVHQRPLLPVPHGPLLAVPGSSTRTAHPPNLVTGVLPEEDGHHHKGESSCCCALPSVLSGYCCLHGVESAAQHALAI
jgi:hypothetical protein